MKTGVATTKAQRDLMRHALMGSGNAREPYRNHFCLAKGGENEDIVAALIGLGLMVRGHDINDGNDYYAHVTEAGAAEIGLKLPDR